MDMDWEAHMLPGAAYDYRRNDCIWKRVSPGMEPYPAGNMADENGENGTAGGKGMIGGMAGNGMGMPALMGIGPVRTGNGHPASGNSSNMALTAAEEQLPGAEEDPCCMGSAAEEMLEVLEGFLEQAITDCRFYRAFLRTAPGSARGTLRRVLESREGQVRRLQAVRYLITGRAWIAGNCTDRIYLGSYAPTLRERYHAEACTAFNYLRAADGTTDPCLARIFRQMAEEGRAAADAMLSLLERVGTCACGGMGI